MVEPCSGPTNALRKSGFQFQQLNHLWLKGLRHEEYELNTCHAYFIFAQLIRVEAILSLS